MTNDKMTKTHTMRKVLVGIVSAAALAGGTVALTDAPAQAATQHRHHETKAERQAVGMAKDYLKYMGFSRKGLIEQLQYEGFSKKNATYGVDHAKANWNHQAVRVAKSYLAYMHFSRSGLIEQLQYEGFTHSQAVYGAHKVGL